MNNVHQEKLDALCKVVSSVRDEMVLEHFDNFTLEEIQACQSGEVDVPEGTTTYEQGYRKLRLFGCPTPHFFIMTVMMNDEGIPHGRVRIAFEQIVPEVVRIEVMNMLQRHVMLLALEIEMPVFVVWTDEYVADEKGVPITEPDVRDMAILHRVIQAGQAAAMMYAEIKQESKPTIILPTEKKILH